MRDSRSHSGKITSFLVAMGTLALVGCTGLREGAQNPFEPLTTSVADAYEIASWLDDSLADQTPVETDSLDLAPGYYEITVDSFCLMAGKFGPTEGSGYLMAPMMGRRAELVRNILQRSASHPETSQQDIQQLLWSIEAGANFRDLPLGLRMRVSPLLTPGEMARLSIDFGDWAADQLPEEWSQLADVFNQLRDRLTDARATFEELEALAVRTGEAPTGPGSRQVDPGAWSYVGDGFYLRAFPSGYSTTRLEVFRPAPFHLERDDRGRIIRFQSGPYEITTQYDDSPGSSVVSAPGREDIHIWSFSTIRLRGPGPDDELTTHGRGWILQSSYPPGLLEAGRDSAAPVFRTALLTYGDRRPRISLAQDVIPEKWKEAKARVDRAREFKGTLDRIKKYRDLTGRGTRPPSEQDIRDLVELEHYREGMDSAINPLDFEGRGDWVNEHLVRLKNAWQYVNCRLAGDCEPPDDDPPKRGGPRLKRFDPSESVATPANTSRQRLGLSGRPVKLKRFDPDR